MACSPEPVCLAVGQAMLELFKSWGIRKGSIRILVNNRNTTPIKPEELKTHFDCDLTGVVPLAKEAYWATQAKHLPLMYHQPDSLAAVQLSRIAGALKT